MNELALTGKIWKNVEIPEIKFGLSDENYPS